MTLRTCVWGRVPSFSSVLDFSFPERLRNLKAEIEGGLDVLTSFLPQDCLAGLVRQSTAKTETEGLQGPQERQVDPACRAPWDCRASVSLQPASEPRPTPLHASRSLDPSRGRDIRPRQSPVGILGGRTRAPLGGHAPHASVQETSFSRTFHLGSRSPEEKEILKHGEREGRASDEKVRPRGHVALESPRSREDGVAFVPGAPLGCYQNKHVLNLHHPPLAILSSGQVD